VKQCETVHHLQKVKPLQTTPIELKKGNVVVVAVAVVAVVAVVTIVIVPIPGAGV
jgi:hypothetical protein